MNSVKKNTIKIFGNKKIAWKLLVISFLALFAELLLIRWLPLRIRLLAYFSNLILLTALLGMGLGMALSYKYQVRLIKYFPILLLLLTFIAVIVNLIPDFILPLADNRYFIWNGLSRMKGSFGTVSYGILILILSLNTGLFVCFGQEIGRLFNKLKPITAYTINILGSILGVVGFSLLSATSFSPVIWIILLICGYFYYLKTEGFHIDSDPIRKIFIPFLITVLLVYSSTTSKRTEYIWSPYYEIQVQDITINNQKVGFGVWVNQDSHQQTLDLSGKFNNQLILGRKKIYELPYEFLPNRIKRVLILGAGTGNDVAAALRSGAQHVDAIEIDPIIAKLGKQHPEKPYDNPKVNLVIDDAKAFVERTANKYDVISYGFLDSHRLFSSMSSVRLENYMYTWETMEKVKSLLNPGGLVAVTYTVHEKWIADRIYNLLRQTFNNQPIVFQGDKYGWGTVFIAGDNTLINQSDIKTIDSQFIQFLKTQPDKSTWGYGDLNGFLSEKIFSQDVLVPTDDWPHLFLQKSVIPNNYLLVLLILMGLSILVIKKLLPFKATFNLSSGNFFFLGAAFALLETKGITELGVLLGTTWITNSAVIASVLFMILIANIYVLKTTRTPISVVYGLLIGTVLLNYFLPLVNLVEFNLSWRIILAGLRIALPILFSGILFALFLKNTKAASTALGMNLLGSMFGGILEYTSLIWGQKVLFIIALFFYLVSFLLWKISKISQTPKTSNISTL